MFGKNKISEERFDTFGDSVNTFAQIVIVGTHQGIKEMPWTIGKRFVADVEAKHMQVFDCKILPLYGASPHQKREFAKFRI